MNGNDGNALGRVYRELKDDLYTAAYHLTGDSASAEDVLQDVFVALARDGAAARQARDLRAWLLVCCLNRARDLVRKRKRAPVAADGLDGRFAAGVGPGEAAERTEEAERIAAALGEIPAEQREVVVLRVYGRLKFREISELLDTSINTVQSRHRYALEALRARLAGKGAER